MVCILLLYLYQWVGAFLVRRFDVFRQSSALDIVNGVLSGGGGGAASSPGNQVVCW